MCWLADSEWRDPSPGAAVTDDDLLDELFERFEPTAPGGSGPGASFQGGKWRFSGRTAPPTLVGELYDLLGQLQARKWDLADPLQVNRLGIFARSAPFRPRARGL